MRGLINKKDQVKGPVSIEISTSDLKLLNTVKSKSKICFTLSICGEAYKEMGVNMLESFLSSVSADICIFTDDTPFWMSQAEKFSKIGGERCHILSFDDCLEAVPELLVKKIENLTTASMVNIKRPEKPHKHSVVSLVHLLAQIHIDSEYIVKIDADTLFVGDIIPDLEKEIENFSAELYLVDRGHDHCFHWRGATPGCGFTMWERSGDYLVSYVRYYARDEQFTICRVLPKKIPTHIIARNGLHLVYPFKQQARSKRVFTKEMLDTHLPAYIHLDAPGIEEKQAQIKQWYSTGKA